MISSISSNNYQYQSQSVTKTETKLTDDQKTTLQSILDKYDPENMTEDSLMSMMDEIKEAGITPSKEFGEIMDTAGFERPEPPSGPPPSGPPPSSSTSNSKTTQLVTDFLSLKDSGQATEDDLNTLLKTLIKSGENTSGLLIDKFS
ncbi:MAG: hypothetical protein V1773_14670 [bacterium]